MSTVLFVIHIKIRDNIARKASQGSNRNLPLVTFNSPADNNLDGEKTAQEFPKETLACDNQGGALADSEDQYRNDELSKLLTDALKTLAIKNASWSLSDGKQFWQVMFTAGAGEQCDHILNYLLVRGIGNKWSTISIIPVTIHFPSIIQWDELSASSNESINNKSDEESSPNKKSRQDDPSRDKKKNQFLKSVKSRLTVAQVIDVVKTNSMLTFDYIVLIIMASMIAAIGLLENSSVLLVASMLVSPLMGPILGGTFGIVIRYKYLWKMGIQNEMIGLFLCVACGFVFGLVCAVARDHGASITTEMRSRGELRGLYVGVMVAIPSGAGVALSILGGNQGSLVGVAISASLLPPAVNGGICWAFSLVSALGFRGSDPGQLASTGAVSMSLTLVNIIVIFIMGCIVLKIKEVAPKTGTALTTAFWKEDLKLTRSYLRGTNNETDVTGLVKEWERLNGLEDDSLVTLKGDQAVTAAEQFRQFIRNAEDDRTFAGVASRLPSKPNLNPIPNAWRADARGSRFSVTKAYFPSSTTFSSNPRFTVRRLDEEDQSTTDPSAPLLSVRTVGSASGDHRTIAPWRASAQPGTKPPGAQQSSV